jgi:hypothetical protein
MVFVQVTLLSKGRLMYHGPTSAMVPWFNVLGYPYDPAIHGAPSDWVLDLVSLGFDKRSDEEVAPEIVMDAASQEMFEDAISEVEGGLEFAAVASPKAQAHGKGSAAGGSSAAIGGVGGDGVAGRGPSGSGGGSMSPGGGVSGALSPGSPGPMVNRRLSLEEVQAVVASKVTHDAMAYTMSSQRELENAAAAFRFCQKQLKPEWFEPVPLASSSSNGNLVRTGLLAAGGSAGDYLKPQETVEYEGYMGKFAGMGHVLQVPESAALAQQLRRHQAGDDKSSPAAGASGVAVAVRAGGAPETRAAAAAASAGGAAMPAVVAGGAATGGVIANRSSSSSGETHYGDARSTITGAAPNSPHGVDRIFEPITAVPEFPDASSRRGVFEVEPRAEVQMLGSGLGQKKKAGFWSKVRLGWMQFKALMWRDYLTMIR